MAGPIRNHRSLILSQKVLSPGQPASDVDAVGTMNSASGAVATTNGKDFRRQSDEFLSCVMKISAKIVIGQVTQLIGHGHALGTFAFALVAHAAIA